MTVSEDVVLLDESKPLLQRIDDAEKERQNWEKSRSREGENAKMQSASHLSSLRDLGGSGDSDQDGMRSQ